MNLKYLLVASLLVTVAIATYGLSKLLYDFAECRAWGERALAAISFYTMAILISCLVGGLGALALSFPADSRRPTVRPAGPPSTM